MRRTAQYALLYVLEGLAIFMALVIFGLAAILWRLASGPVEVDLLRPLITEQLIKAFDGDVASVGGLRLGFNPDNAALIVTAEDLSVARRGGEVIAATRHIEVGVALDLLLIGEISPVSLKAEGGVFTVGRNSEGQIVAQLGAGDVDLGAMMSAQSVPQSQGPSQIRPLLKSLMEEGTDHLLPRLREIDIRQADIRVFDAVNDFVAVIEDGEARLIRSNRQIALEAEGQWLTSAGPAPLSVRFETGSHLESLLVDVRVTNLNPAVVAPRSGILAQLGQVDVPLDLELVLDAARDTGLGAVMVRARAGQGVIHHASKDYALNAARLHLAYDTLANEIQIHDLVVDGELLNLDVTGRLYEFSGFETSIPSTLRYDLSLVPGRFEWPGFFRDPIIWQSIDLSGEMRPLRPEITFERLDIVLPKASAQFTGAVSLDTIDTGGVYPSVNLVGPIEGDLSTDDVLGLWPIDFAVGARDWLAESILGGRLFDAHMDMSLKGQDIADRTIPDEDLALSFHFSNGDVRYISTMTPLLGVEGSATLFGNGFELSSTGGMIGDLVMERSYVRIDQLEPKGGLAVFGGVGHGKASDFIALIDEEPLGYASQYGLRASDFGGRGRLQFSITRPMLSEVPIEDIGFDIEGDFEDITGPLVFGPDAGMKDGPQVEDGVMHLTATPDGMVGEGQAIAAGIPARIRWEENFKAPDDEPSTTMHIEARAQARDLARLGMPVRRFLDGPMGLVVNARGKGVDFSTLQMDLDLSDTAISAPMDLWQKAPGDAANSRLEVRFSPQGISLETFSLNAGDAEIEASAMIDHGGRLLQVNAERLSLTGLMDLAVRGSRPDGVEGPLHLAVTGAYLDAMTLVDAISSNSAPANNGEEEGASAVSSDGEREPFESDAPPLIVEASIEAMDLRDVRFTNVDVLVHSQLEGVERFALSALGPGGPVEVYFQPNDAGTARALSLTGGSAGTLLTAATGFSQIEGGNLTLVGEAPLLGQEGPITGRLDMGAFRLVRMPLLARILAAGSFEGLGSLLSGEGLVFERFSSDFTWQNSTLEMRNARAVGPALGITWDGVVDTSEQRLAVDGTILPSYGANSILGGLPVLGELITGRRGEGIIGVVFAVEGPFTGTRVFVNPLSALAPGILRRIFEGTSAERELEALEAQREAMDAARELEAEAQEVREEVDAAVEDLPRELKDEPASEGDE
ncbi:YhdP family protein [Woodsholea maritima]|uniref:YhdP family protein n=1 Tax=Woodsholea maritima TaxID=240237 RepID=UPI00036EC5CA|nr:AsmA-like C-terminal region-containing protein [Woodsholea maritima]